MPASETPTPASAAPTAHLVQGEGCPEDALGQQLLDPKQTFLVIAVWGLGQDLKQLGVVGRGTGRLSCEGRAGTSWPSQLRAEPMDSPPQPLATNEGNTLCAQIFLLPPAHPPEGGRSFSTVKSQDLGQNCGRTGVRLGFDPRS